jgi:hypothetical protein
MVVRARGHAPKKISHARDKTDPASANPLILRSWFSEFRWHPNCLYASRYTNTEAAHSRQLF